MSHKVMLVILDGRGMQDNPEISAIAKAKTPYYDSLLTTYPHTTLVTHSEAVWLPEGQMGNSEVGHMHIGAGRVIYQDLVKISKAFSDETIYDNPVFQGSVRYAVEYNKPVHLIGLLSDGGVHAHIDHTINMIKALDNQWVEKIYVHAFTDGRDTDPKSGRWYIEKLLGACENYGAKLVSVVGRYYAMDRDNRWERVQEAYDLLVNWVGEPSRDILATMHNRYASGETDEFIKPIILTDENDDAIAIIEDGDVVINMNYRSDRAREITKVLTQTSIEWYDMEPLDIEYVCMTPYDETFHGVEIMFPKDTLMQTLGEVISDAGKTQLRVAETEKYPHVTFFFSGWKEAQFPGEDRILCPSPKVATYDLQPSMSAPDIAMQVVQYLDNKQPDFIAINFANTDMVWHTWVFDAVVQAAETVDACLEKLAEKARTLGYEILVIADHGNADVMKNQDGSAHTQHTLSPVPCILITDEQGLLLQQWDLTDIAPTILSRMWIAKPESMTGKMLVL
jgi:2,3-bisphosphoglycerate-independent phosphoglycerate mutase